ncbi:HlyD family efflux transporter periplasmic adaptor subunit [Bartonella sp. B1098]|uniref:HlyD family efflux transporter periplasmic adaptor subunit n=1 Tax=Bartonella sp. B1098 TaxID=2911421 RepID=UPI0020C52123|nr:HlyD family efflux transporter periplasmic adaptor subunit [Bartonella sp. B1098]
MEHEILANQRRLEENSAEIELSLQSLKTKLDSSQYCLDHLSLYAPVDKRIDDLNIHTLGGFVETGKTLMHIVPGLGVLIVEAFFDNQDIGF